jgi:soluble lytic murein transglycosylase-like protein
MHRQRRARPALTVPALLAACLVGLAQAQPVAPRPDAPLPPLLTLDGLPRPATPPPERGPVVPAQVERWRKEAKALEYGEGVPRDPVRAAELYCRAARHGDADAQFSLAWMLTNARGIERNEAQAAHLFAAAAEQGIEQARNIVARMGAPRGAPPACLRPPEDDALVAAAQASAAAAAAGPRSAATMPPAPPPPRNAPDAIVRFVNLVAPEYQLAPHLVLAFMATESNFDAFAISPKNAQGLMQLLPGTAQRFGVKSLLDPAQNIRGGMAYLRWLMAYFEGDLRLVAAAYNAGERAVERYLGVPPYAETRMYVYKVLVASGGQISYPFDAAATPPSTALPAIKPLWRLR